jgi:hypothetical protein
MKANGGDIVFSYSLKENPFGTFQNSWIEYDNIENCRGLTGCIWFEKSERIDSRKGFLAVQRDFSMSRSAGATSYIGT